MNETALNATTLTVPSFAVPSCVIPDTVANNAFFLAQKAQIFPQIQEIGLCFFETKSCLDYTMEDLPTNMAELGFRWHVHLPLDLPWSNEHAALMHKCSTKQLQNNIPPHDEHTLSGFVAADFALAVLQKAAHLTPRLAILHPPTSVSMETQARLLQEFASVWYTKISTPVLLENIKGAPLYTLPKTLFESSLSSKGYGVCLDIGHMFTYKQETIIHNEALLSSIQMVHWSAPGEEPGHDKHYSLERLNLQQKKYIEQLIHKVPNGCTHMIEVFRWQGVESSLPYLQNILEPKAW